MFIIPIYSLGIMLLFVFKKRCSFCGNFYTVNCFKCGYLCFRAIKCDYPCIRLYISYTDHGLIILSSWVIFSISRTGYLGLVAVVPSTSCTYCRGPGAGWKRISRHETEWEGNKSLLEWETAGQPKGKPTLNRGP